MAQAGRSGRTTKGEPVKIISFAKTTPALLAGRKTRTRREWSAKHAARFKAGELCQAWDHVPRVKGAKRVGTIRLTAAPRWEAKGAPVPMDDWEREGFAYLWEIGAMPSELKDLWLDWIIHGSTGLWVVDFDPVEAL